MMNDYKELVAKLRKWQTLGDAPVGNSFGVIVDKLTLKQAADAIEQLVKERDAAVADLKEGSFCMNCKHLVSTKEEKPCRYCSSLTGGGEDNWEWRGVQEDNDGKID